MKHTATGKGTATETRHFPLPAILHPQGRALDGVHFPVIIGSDFRMPGCSVKPCLEEVLDAVDGKAVQALSPDDHVTCDLLILRYPPAL